MDFNSFIKRFRQTPAYDEVINAKPKDIPAKHFIAIFYANDLYDNDYKLFEILKLFDKQYWKLVSESLRERMKPSGIRVAWTAIVPHLFVAKTYNRNYYDHEGYKRYVQQNIPYLI